MTGISESISIILAKSIFISYIALVFLNTDSFSIKYQPKVYTLHSDNLQSPSYIVGPEPLRRALQYNSLRSVKRLQNAREEHHRLEQLIEATSAHSPEVSMLKKLKLKAKDNMVRLIKQNALNECKPVLSNLLVELGVGGYGKVLFGHSLNSNEEVAIKISSVEDYSQLWKEHLVLHRLSNFPGFTKVHFFGKQNILDIGVHIVMVMDVLGPSIEKLFQYTTLGVRGFSPLTVLLIAEQMIDRLEVLSNFNIVHGDIQPGNILLGRGNHNSTFYLIDFGLSTLSSIEDKNSEIFRGAFNKTQQPAAGLLKGTLPFSSIRAMQGGENLIETDDLESLGYTLAYLLCNELPWTVKGVTNVLPIGSEGLIDEEYDRQLIQNILSIKKKCLVDPNQVFTVPDIVGTPVAEAISQLLAYTFSLRENPSSSHGGLNVKPDYQYLRRLIKESLQKQTINHQNLVNSSSSSSSSLFYKFDWELEGINWNSSSGIMSYVTE